MPPKLEQLRRWIDANRKVAVGIVGAAIAYLVVVKPEIPPMVFVVGGSLAVAGIVGYVGAEIIDWYTDDPEHIYYVKVGFPDGGIWQLTPAKHERTQVIEGELHELSWTTHRAYEVEDYEPELDLAVGTWRGSATNLELIEDRERIDEIRDDLEAMAQEGLSYRIKAGRATRQAVADILNGLLASAEGATFDFEEKVESSIEGAIRDHDLAPNGEPVEVDGGTPEEESPAPPGEEWIEPETASEGSK